jgi:hypothetical protein
MQTVSDNKLISQLSSALVEETSAKKPMTARGEQVLKLFAKLISPPTRSCAINRTPTR